MLSEPSSSELLLLRQVVALRGAGVPRPELALLVRGRGGLEVVAEVPCHLGGICGVRRRRLLKRRHSMYCFVRRERRLELFVCVP